nr:lachesin-like [Penaeus vannamei]
MRAGGSSRLGCFFIHIQGVPWLLFQLMVMLISTAPVTHLPASQFPTFDLPVPPTIEDAHSSPDVEVREGEEARLSCGATGTPTPTILWRREDARLIRLPGQQEPMWKGSTLVLPHVRKEDIGAYLCIANNGVPPSVSKRVRLNVRFEPVVRAAVPSVSTPLGGSVNFSCVVDGWPTPSLHWMRDSGQPVVSPNKVYQLQDRIREELENRNPFVSKHIFKVNPGRKTLPQGSQWRRDQTQESFSDSNNENRYFNLVRDIDFAPRKIPPLIDNISEAFLFLVF